MVRTSRRQMTLSIVASFRLATMLSLLYIAIGAGTLRAADPAIVDAKAAGKDFELQGEYEGKLKLGGEMIDCGAQVIALGDGEFEVVGYLGGLPGKGWDPAVAPKRHNAKSTDGVLEFDADHGKAKLSNGKLSLVGHGGEELGALKRVDRKSATLGEAPPEGAVVLFDGTSADKFHGGSMTDDKLLNVGAVSKDKFQDFKLHLEFRTPYMPASRGQGRGNSGVYLQNRYEVQVLDSFGLEGRDNECGGVYSASAPKVNMCLPPLSWQTYDIDFTAAKFDEDGKKTKNAVVTVRHNGVVIHENLELPTFTPGGEGKEAPTPGPIQLQHHGNPVHFRNIWVVEK